MQQTMKLNAPASKAFRPKPRAAVVPTPQEDDEDTAKESAVSQEQSAEAGDQAHTQQAVVEEDEEVRIAMEMALAAAQNPHLSVVALRKLVSDKNKQVEIVEQVQQKKELEKQREREEQQKRWNEQKEKVVGWWHVKAETVVSGVSAVHKAAERKAEEIQDRYERRMYAEDIQNDQLYQDIRKRCKFLQKTLKAHRLQGNRVETRHSFKRQRQEKKLLQLYEKIDKTQKLFTAGSYNIHEYAKAMMRASKKWNKKSSGDHELALEAQLCRNMHQMLSIEKQKSKVKKSTREMKKYLQRCKGWLSDKKALCEMHIMTLDATDSSMVFLYQDTISRQDALIKRLKEAEEFAGIDLESVELAPGWRELNMLQEHNNSSVLGPSATLAALRGLPINDSIRLRRTALEKEEMQQQRLKPAPSSEMRKPSPEFMSNDGGPQLYIETKDDASVSSHLSDPDDDGVEPFDQSPYPATSRADSFGDSDSGLGEFDRDAPWMHASSSAAGGTNSIEEEEEGEAEPPSMLAANIIDSPPPDASLTVGSGDNGSDHGGAHSAKEEFPTAPSAPHLVDMTVETHENGNPAEAMSRRTLNGVSCPDGVSESSATNGNAGIDNEPGRYPMSAKNVTTNGTFAHNASPGNRSVSKHSLQSYSNNTATSVPLAGMELDLEGNTGNVPVHQSDVSNPNYLSDASEVDVQDEKPEHGNPVQGIKSPEIEDALHGDPVQSQDEHDSDIESQ